MRKKQHVKATPITAEEYLENEIMEDNKQQNNDKLDDLINF